MKSSHAAPEGTVRVGDGDAVPISGLGGFRAGLGDYFRAMRLVRRRGLWAWLMLPGLISVAYVPAMIWVSVGWGGRAETWLREQALPSYLQHRVVSFLLVAALWLAGLYAGFILFRHVLMILCAPLLGYISARTEEAAEGSLASVPPVHPVTGALRAVGMSLAGLAVSVAGLLAGLVLLLIPVAGGLLMTVWLAVLQMFLAGHGFMDPTFERHGVGVRASLGGARACRMRTLGLGAGFLMLTSVPVVGWFLGPTLGVVAGTLSALAVEPVVCRRVGPAGAAGGEVAT